MEAEMVCGLLRSAGIECYAQAAAPLFGSRAGNTWLAQEIVVDERDLEAARALLAPSAEGDDAS